MRRCWSLMSRLAASLDDKARLGMFYAWLGWAKWWRTKDKESCGFLDKALKIGEEIQDPRVIGYASCWLAYAYFELGLLSEAETSAEKALSMARFLPNDQYLSSKPFTALGFIHYYRGYGQKTLAAGKQHLDHGEKHENIRSTVMGHLLLVLATQDNGNFSLAIESLQRAVETTEDPLYKKYALTGLSLVYAESRKFELAKESANEVIEYSNRMGTEQLGTYSAIPQSVALVTEGHMAQGLKQLKELSQALWARRKKTSSRRSRTYPGKHLFADRAGRRRAQSGSHGQEYRLFNQKCSLCGQKSGGPFY